MTSYLDISGLQNILDRYYATPALYQSRLVGRERAYASAYFDIARFFGKTALDPFAVPIEYLPEPFRFADPLIAEFSAQIERELKSQGRLYDGLPAVRLYRFDGSSQPARILLQLARYADQCAGFAMDYPSALFARWGGTLRGYIAATYPDRDTARSPLAGCLGICGLLVTQDQESRHVLFVHRSAKLASLENSIGPSSAGSVESEPKFATLGELMEQSLGREVTEELGLSASEYRIHPLAYAREVLRGDRPQLFCLIQTDLPAREIGARLERLEESRREFDRFQFARVDPRQGLTQSDLAPLNFEAVMNWYLVEEFLAQE